MAEPIEGRGGQQAIGREGLIPHGEIEIAGDDGGGALIAFGDQVVEIFVGGRAQGFEPKVVDDQKWNAGERGDLAFDGADGARRRQAGAQLSLGGEEHVDAL